MTTDPKLRTGRVWRRFCFCCFAALLICGLALRLEAAIYARRITSVVSALSTLRVGETSQAEALSRLPRLRASAIGPYSDSPCNADRCFFVGVGNGLPGRILWGTRNRALASLLRWWGFRFENLNVWATFTSGRVSYVSYWLMVVGTRRAAGSSPSAAGRRSWCSSDFGLPPPGSSTAGNRTLLKDSISRTVCSLPGARRHRASGLL